MRKFLLSVFSLSCICTDVTSQIPSKIKKILNKIDPSAIKAHMTFLADDLLEGRQPGTRGFLIASKYMETQFISLGLKPGVNDTSYIQRVPLQKASVNDAESELILIDQHGKEEKLEYTKNFTLSPVFDSPLSNVTAPLVFVGYGISAPEFGYDAYAGIDVKGKIVVYLSGTPSGIPNDPKAFYGGAAQKYTEAVKRGAVGVITFARPTGTATRTRSDTAVRRQRPASYKWASEQGIPGNSFPQLKAVASLNSESAKKLFVNSTVPIQKIFDMAGEGKSESFPLNISSRIKVSTNKTTVESANIIGVIEGSDPVLKNEYIIYTAHLDHLGIGTPVKGDSIYNGAHDDASGNAIILEIAKAYRSLTAPPRRSIIFAIVTGEELGLLGSDYLINHQPMKGRIVANLAIDMPFFFHPVLDLVPYGADHSSLGKQTEKAAEWLGLKISPDPIPDQVVFIRSDHYSFIKKGIPALFIKSGFMTVSSDTTNRARTDVAWRNGIYHRPQDDMSQAFDFDAAATHVKVNFLIGYLSANDPQAPVWNKNDFFGNRFANKK